MALEECTWMVSIGAVLFFLNSCVLGTRSVTGKPKVSADTHLHSTCLTGANNLALA